MIPNYPQTFVETGRDSNSGHYAVGATRPHHASPVSQFKEPQFNRYQTQEQVHLSSRQDMIRPPRFPHQELPREPTNINAKNYNMRNDRINPQPRTPMKPSATFESVTDYQRGDSVMSSQQRDYAEMSRQELFHENEGSTSGGVGNQFPRSRVADDRAHMQYSGPQQGRGKAPGKPSPFLIIA